MAVLDVRDLAPDQGPGDPLKNASTPRGNRGRQRRPSPCEYALVLAAGMDTLDRKPPEPRRRSAPWPGGYQGRFLSLFVARREDPQPAQHARRLPSEVAVTQRQVEGLDCHRKQLRRVALVGEPL